MSINLPDRLAELNLTLPEAPAAVAQYVPALRSGSHIFVSGQLPLRKGKLIASGLVPSAVDLEQASEAARQCVLNGLAAVDQVLEGDWSGVVRIARIAVFVASDPDFHLQHKVANGASELLGDLFGDAGRHARAAVGVTALPMGASVEVELVVEVR
ncbi:MAG: RidA family protein [Phycisphaeraceae bacterium]